jgi:hypothetical protein
MSEVSVVFPLQLSLGESRIVLYDSSYWFLSDICC